MKPKKFMYPSMVQFAVGRKGGSQSVAIASQEMLALKSQNGATIVDTRAAFQCVSRGQMADGVAACAEGGGREILAFLIMVYKRDARLSYHTDDGEVVILGKTGCTQGCSLGMQMFCLAIQPLLIAAAEKGPLCTILAIADDVTVLGPLEQRITVVNELIRVFAAQNLEIRKLNNLAGVDEPPISLSDLKARFPATVEEVTVSSMRESGALVGVTDAIPAGIRIVGGPVGTIQYARSFVRNVIDQHRKRLKHVITLGLSNPQNGLLALHHCGVGRINFLQQIVPYLVAPDEYDAAQRDIDACFQEIAGITDEEMDKPAVRSRMALPYASGGQGIIDLTHAGDAATAGTWACCASWLRINIPALARMGAPQRNGRGPSPRWNMLDPTFARLAALGPAVAAVLPSLSLTLAAPTDHLQHKLLAAMNKISFDNIIGGLDHIYGMSVRVRDGIIAAMHSQAGEGALSWHLVPGYAAHVVMARPQYLAILRFELSLPQIGLRGREYNVEIGHAVLNQASNTPLGGRYRTHNAVVGNVITFAIAAGYAASTACGALVGPRPGTTSDVIADCVITGMDNDKAGLLGDVSLIHPVSAAGIVKHRAHITPGACAAVREREKNQRYTQGGFCARQGYEFVAMVLETYGYMAPDFIAFLRRLAAAAAGNVDTLRMNERDTSKAYAGRLYTRWLRQISMTRARSVANRLRGASVQTSRAIADAAAVQHAASIITAPV
jgi:hypothetical protein